MNKPAFWQKYQLHLETLFVFLLAASLRLTSLNVFRAIDEEDRWAWAVDFYRALLAGNLPATLVGDGYPGIFPVWLETIWLFLASLYRSVWQGGWIGDEGVYLLIHEWARTSNLYLQRFPVVLANTVLVVLIFLYARHLFGRRVALLAALFIGLDPFILSDSRVNRAEGLLTGLMTLSLLALIAALRNHQLAPNSNKHATQYAPPHPLLFKLNTHLLISAIFGGLAWLTKSQALALIPMFGVISLLWYLRQISGWLAALRRWVVVMAAWGLTAAATFILLWPAVWTVPGSTFRLMYNYATFKVGQEGVKIFFLGQTVLDQDPGLLFYPVNFALRATPLLLIGLLVGVYYLFLYLKKRLSLPLPRLLTGLLDEAGIWALIAYALLYIGGMSLGSHKQDRFLMAAFPALNLLAAMAYIQLARRLNWPERRLWAAGAALLALQLMTALPYHPYYFSYFNPLLGGGATAQRLTRIGWGEGMDQVGAYLQSLPNANSLTVASRFSNYLVGYKGNTLNLDSDGEWLHADKIVFYIQQSQRQLDPSPGVIRYFQQRVRPEKVVIINGIDYAQVYPNPVHYPADPEAAQIPGQIRLFGYRWQAENNSPPAVRLIWENLSKQPQLIGTRLWLNADTHSPWLACATAPGFEESTRTPGEVVESDCPLAGVSLPPGLYDLQVGVRQAENLWEAVDFASGWSAVEVSASGNLRRVDPQVAFAQLADDAVPESATPLEHTYYERVRLLAYRLTPEQPQPGQPLTVTLYWQALRMLNREANVSLQLFTANEQRLAMVNGAPLGGHQTRPTTTWRPGEVIEDVWTLDLPPDTPAPALLRLDVGLFLPDTLTPLPVRNLAGQDIPAAIAHVRVTPPEWPSYQGDHPLDFTLNGSIQLMGYEVGPPPQDGSLDITLYWQALASPGEPATAFVHLLNPEGQLVAQNDVPPANGLYPTWAWQPGEVVLSYHRLALPAGLPPGEYSLLAGLYHPADGARLPVQNADNQPLPNDAAPIGRVSLVTSQ